MIISNDRHTESSLVDLFSRKSKDREYLNHNLNHHSGHCGSSLNLSIDTESSEEVLDALEDVK